MANYGNDAQKSMHSLTAFLGAISKTVVSAEKGMTETGRSIGDAKAAIAGRFTRHLTEEENTRLAQTDKIEINENNCAVYYYNSQPAAMEAAKYLAHNDVPGFVVTTELNNEKGAMILVPKDYEKVADSFVQEANKVLNKTEMTRDEFFSGKLGSRVIEYGGLSAEQLRLFRDNIYDRPAAYCVARQGEGTYKVYTSEDSRGEVARAIHETSFYLKSSRAEDFKAVCEAKDESNKQIISYVAHPTEGKDLVLFDYSDPEGRALRVQKDRMIEYKNGEQVNITLNKDPQEYAARIMAMTNNYKAVAVGEIDSKEKEIKAPEMQQSCSREELVAVSKTIAHVDKINGYMSTPECMAGKITSLMVAANSNDIQQASDVIKSSMNTAQLAAWAEQAEISRYGVAELYELCQKTSLDVTVDQNVLQFAREDINHTLEMMNSGELTITERESDMTDLGVDSIVNDIIPNIETLDEYTGRDDRGDINEPGFDEPDVDEPDFMPEPDDFGEPDIHSIEARPSLDGESR